MKANGAPEKIYFSQTEDGRQYFTPAIPFEREFVEYMPVDAFIKKACEWIEKNMDDYIHVEYDTVTGRPTNEAHIAHKKVVEDFEEYMKGE